MTYNNEFDDLPRGGSGFLSTIGPKAAFFAVLIALSFMVGVVWKLYIGSNEGTASGQNVPIVRADDAPFKVIPDDPGGMEIPHRDSTIFSSLKSEREGGGNRIENLLANDKNEDPLPRSQLFAGLNTEANPDIDAPAQDSPLDKPAGNAAQQMTDEIVPKKTEPVVKPVTEPKPVVKPAPEAAIVPAPKPVAGGYYIQLGSVKTNLGAQSEWKKIIAKYPNQLSGFSHRVEKADLGEKGIFYRIQAGPLNKDKATRVCNDIKKINPGACLVKKK